MQTEARTYTHRRKALYKCYFDKCTYAYRSELYLQIFVFIINLRFIHRFMYIFYYCYHYGIMRITKWNEICHNFVSYQSRFIRITLSKTHRYYQVSHPGKFTRSNKNLTRYTLYSQKVLHRVILFSAADLSLVWLMSKEFKNVRLFKSNAL